MSLSDKREKLRPHVAVLVDSTGNYGRLLLLGIAEYAETQENWSLFIETRGTGRLNTRWLENWAGDGILAYIEDINTASSLLQAGIPIVETYGHACFPDVPSVGNDDIAIGRMAGEHLAERRFIHFGYCGYPSQSWCKLRLQGFREAVDKRASWFDTHFIPRSFPSLRRWEKSQVALGKWLIEAPKPLGLMACSDRCAQQVLDACRRVNLKVPDQVAVLGSDNDEVLCRVSDPPLSSVADNPRKIGYEAARLLSRLMLEKRSSEERMEPIMIPPQGVITRRSTEAMVTDDAIIAQALQYIRDHASESIDASAVVRQFPLSRSAFYRRFSDAVGHSPHEEIIRVRINRIRELLVQTSLPLSRIAHLSGFGHTEYMVAVFKRRVGITPGKYRTKHRIVIDN
ncbi:DNA-binding transcriptional regulator [Blastopirellula sp. J2-11]|uniref:AraC family transcriptional regulator n=1 Tax=Blastopirellula sp. J2-11 TaxID=2943192 RepID=UPI0021C6E949|nr:DNA-binding transcriptional regulator [Blastopirellula sp. J2-11]UUO04522.1 DNA-binding transcriptional regulator [Blastopirellula sp. J2-11]